MEHPVIRVESLSKCYRIDRAAGGGRFGYRTLRDDLTRLATAPWRLFKDRAAERSEDFWALNDVSFEVRSGEVLGVVGKNGAGKSTLLKILSRITKPTRGGAWLRGRIGSLLEVGTGFHPELSGRENIFLNGAILGMSRREIARRFDEIVAFAEVEKFLDTPVKRYSSGMYVRLAFAVAAHLEPEILIIDEVLAVGDIAFQRKCMGRMREVGRGGATVLFVSHNMPAVESLCTRAVLLDGGRIVRDGDVPTIIADFRRRTTEARDDGHAELGGRVLRSAGLHDETGEQVGYMPLGGRFHLRIGLDSADPIELPTIGIGIDDAMGQRLLTLHTPLSEVAVSRVAGRCAVDCVVDPFPLAPGDYWVKLVLSARGAEIESVERAFSFTVDNAEMFGEGRGFGRGLCVAPSRWRLIESTELEPIGF